MSDSKDRIPLQISNKVVLVPIRYQLTQMVPQYLKEDLLKFIAEHTAIGVIFDLKGMEMVDAPDFEELTSIIRMIRLMGLKSVVCGISAGSGFFYSRHGYGYRKLGNGFGFERSLSKTSKNGNNDV